MSDHEQEPEEELADVRQFKTPMSGLPMQPAGEPLRLRHALPGPPDMREYNPSEHDGDFAELERMRAEFHGNGQRSPQDLQDAAYAYLLAVGLTPTPDAVGQMTHVFLKCLTIMCERGYEPNGQLWRAAGKMGALADVRKKFFRLWQRAWHKRQPHDDSAIDLINYVGFYLRCDDAGWGEWGEPGEISPSD